MYLEIRTDELTEADAFALAVLIHQQFPQVLGKLAFMTGAAHAALNTRPAASESPVISAEEAFGGEDAPASIAPSAEEAFGDPQHQEAAASAVTGAAGNGVQTSGQVALDGAGAGPSAATVSPSEGPAAKVDTDSTGLPWDGRIHSSNHKKTAAGAWAKRKNVDAATVTTVEAELRARMAAGPLASTPPAAPLPPVNAAPTSSTIPSTPVPAAPVAAIAPPPPGAPAVSAPPVPPVSAPTITPGPAAVPAPTAPLTPEAIAYAQGQALAAAGAPAPPAAPSAVLFADVMREVVDATAAGTLNAQEVGQISAAVGIESPRDLLTKPALCGPFLETLRMYLASKQPQA
jgi:hypothetical protein